MASQSTPPKTKAPCTVEDSSVICVDRVSFSDPCPRCATKKRHCLHADCGCRKKLRLTNFPATPTVRFMPQTPLHRSFSFPIRRASDTTDSPGILRTYSDHVAVGRMNDAFTGLRLAVDQNTSPAADKTAAAPGDKEGGATVSVKTENKERRIRRLTRTRRRLLMDGSAKENGEKTSELPPSIDKEKEKEENQPSKETPSLITESPTQQKAMEITSSTLPDESLSPAKSFSKMPEDSIRGTTTNKINLSDKGRETGDELPLPSSVPEIQVPCDKSYRTSSFLVNSLTQSCGGCCCFERLSEMMDMLEKMMKEMAIKKDKWADDQYHLPDGILPPPPPSSLSSPQPSSPSITVTTTAIVPRTRTTEEAEKEFTPASASSYLCSCNHTFRFHSA